MKKLVLVVSAITALGLTSVLRAADAPVAKVAFFNFQQAMPMPVDEKVLSQAPLEWQDSIKNLMNEMESRAKKLRAKGEKLEKMMKEVKEKSKLATDTALDSRKEEMQQLNAEIELGSKQLQQYQEESFGKLQQAFYIKVANEVNTYAMAHGWDIVTPMALFAKGQFNITDDVISSLNKAYAAEKAEKEKAKTDKKESTKSNDSEKVASKPAVKAA